MKFTQGNRKINVKIVCKERKKKNWEISDTLIFVWLTFQGNRLRPSIEIQQLVVVVVVVVVVTNQKLNRNLRLYISYYWNAIFVFKLFCKTTFFDFEIVVYLFRQINVLVSTVLLSLSISGFPEDRSADYLWSTIILYWILGIFRGFKKYNFWLFVAVC